jgi:hypothetical protein
MNQPVNGAEDRLRQALRREAAHAEGLGTDFAQVRTRAVRVRRRRRVVAVGLAAAAVAVVTVPTTLLLRNDENAGPQPTHQPTTPPPSVSPSPHPPSPSTTTHAPRPTKGPLLLSSVEEGPAPSVDYLQGRIFVPIDGNKFALPGNRPVTEFTSYHGGWLLVDADKGHLYQYDSQGRESDLGRNGMLAVSGDGGPTAFQTATGTKIGIATGMGEGEQTVPLPKDAGIVGFLGPNLVYSRASGGAWVHQDSGADRRLPLLANADSASRDGTRVAGQVATSPAGDGVAGALLDVNSGRLLWQDGWRLLSFSPDGKYLAGVPVGDNGDAATIAIIDAATGKAVQQMHLIDRKLYLAGLPPAIAWEDDDSLLFDVADRTGHEAILRLRLDGTVNRATAPAPTVDAQPAYLFPVQP